VVAVGNSLLDAFQRLETLDFCARTHMYAARLGGFSTLTDAQTAQFDPRENRLPEFTPTHHTSHARERRAQLVDIVHRAYARQLMISTEGVASARIEGGGFLITPTAQDRQTLDAEDIVWIQDGQREVGKLPSRSVHLHAAIYARHPDIQCIMTAQAPYATAYAVAHTPMNTRTIPESYIMLRDVPRVPFGAQFNDYDAIASVIGQQRPVIFIQNDCVMTVGTSVLQAFDRLEVAEFTARSLLDTVGLGALVPMGQPEIDALEQKFFT
jgi:L-fuculose-phosphate aldolase